jgi:hypothetical protein
MFPHIAPASSNDSVAKFNVGGLYFGPTGEVYRYVQAEDANIVVGDVLCYAWDGTTGDWEVTNTATSAIDSALATVNIVAGVAVGSITDAYFGFVQVSGLCGDVTTDTGVAAGDNLVVDGANTPNGVADTAVAGEEHAVFGLALAADVSDSVDAILRMIL